MTWSQTVRQSKPQTIAINCSTSFVDFFPTHAQAPSAMEEPLQKAHHPSDGKYQGFSQVVTTRPRKYRGSSRVGSKEALETLRFGSAQVRRFANITGRIDPATSDLTREKPWKIWYISCRKYKRPFAPYQIVP